MTINNSFAQTLRSIFTDGGVLLFCVVVPLLYPVLYAFIYNGETVREVPVVVVDDSHEHFVPDVAATKKLREKLRAERAAKGTADAETQETVAKEA